MIDQFFSFLDSFENILWGYVGVPMIMFVGIYLSFQSKFVQIRKFPAVVKIFFGFLKNGDKHKTGVHPLKAFFACVGGAIGVGNIVGICTAAQIGGPGALFWIWVTAIAGMILKYAEVYLGVRYRVTNPDGSYSGGPMYFMQKIFKSKWMPNLVCLLLCVYGVEVYQFGIVTSSISTNLGFNQYLVVAIMLGLVIFAGSGGVQRVGSISSAIIPVFVVTYVGMGLWVLMHNLPAIPSVLSEVFSHAFTGHAAVGGFVGSSLILTISQGVRRGCYTGDVGVGYASVIHSETSVTVPEKQAALVIFDIFLDTFIICTTSVMIILVTSVWKEPIPAALLVQTALGQYFPYMHFFMPFFLFLLGYSTINAYFCVGIKCAEFLSPKRGRMLYFGYATIILAIFSLFDTTRAQTLMTIAGGLLLVINCYGIFRLRKEVSFDIEAKELEQSQSPSPVTR
jgi:AGCS family alanine or glycine:cation symporter